MRRPKLERSLTMLVSLCFSPFVGFCVWFVVDSTSGQLAAKLFNQPAVSQGIVKRPAAENHLAVVTFAAASLSMLLACVVFYRTRFLQFQDCIRDINSLGGTVRFSSGQNATWKTYWYDDATVDLSDSNINDSRLPELSRIPNLVSLRMAGNPITKNALPKILRCRRLERLDVSETRIRNEHLEPLQKLANLTSILSE